MQLPEPLQLAPALSSDYDQTWQKRGTSGYAALGSSNISDKPVFRKQGATLVNL